MQAKNILIATGSFASKIPFEGAEHAITSDEILNLDALPEKCIPSPQLGLHSFMGFLLSAMQIVPVLCDLLAMHSVHGLGRIARWCAGAGLLWWVRATSAVSRPASSTTLAQRCTLL